MSLLTSGVVQGMVGASLHMKSANVAMGIYHQAKADGDKSTMASAAGYAQDSLNSVAESNKQAQEALREAQKEARKQAKAEQEAAIEERRQEAAKDKKQEKKEKIKDAAQQNTQKSDKGKKSQETDAQKTKNITKSSQEEINNDLIDYDVAVVNKKDKVTQGIYTAQGEVKPAAVKQKVVATV